MFPLKKSLRKTFGLFSSHRFVFSIIIIAFQSLKKKKKKNIIISQEGINSNAEKVKRKNDEKRTKY